MKSNIPGFSIKRVSPLETEVKQGENINTELWNSISITSKSIVKVTDRYIIDHYVASPVTIAGIRMQKVRLIDKNKTDSTKPTNDNVIWMSWNDNISFEIIDLDTQNIINLKVLSTDKQIVNIYSPKENLWGIELFKAQLENGDNVFVDDYWNIVKILIKWESSEITRMFNKINIWEKTYVGVETSEDKIISYIDKDTLELFEIDWDIVSEIVPLSTDTKCNYKIITRSGIVYETEKN